MSDVTNEQVKQYMRDQTDLTEQQINTLLGLKQESENKDQILQRQRQQREKSERERNAYREKMISDKQLQEKLDAVNKGGETPIEEVILNHEETVRKSAEAEKTKPQRFRGRGAPMLKPQNSLLGNQDNDFEIPWPTPQTETLPLRREGTEVVADTTDFPKAAKMLLNTAKVMQDRQKHYGSPKKNHTNIAEYWTLWLKQRGYIEEGVQLQAYDAAMMQDLVKTARLGHDPEHLDSIQDKMGYAGVYLECVEN